MYSQIIEEIRVATGITAGILVLFEMFAVVARRVKKINLKIFRGKYHKTLGIAMMLLAIMHGCLAMYTVIIERRLSLPVVVTMLTGILAIAFTILTVFFYFNRSKTKNWIRKHCLAAMALLICGIIHIIFNQFMI